MLPPDIVFHRFFSTLTPFDRERYRGKHHICEPEFDVQIVSLLVGIQDMMNGALSAEKQDVPEHVPHDPFHFDYIDSESLNALAFCHGGYAFIGVTVALVKRCLDVGHGLAASREVTQLLGVPDEKAYADRLVAALTRIQLNSIVAHEWAHHVHGHVRQSEDGRPFEEYREVEGNLDSQARELDADGYSAYLVLAHLLDSQERANVLETIGCADKTTIQQDESLFGLFLCAVEGQLSSLPFVSISESPVYKRTHPPLALRMNSIVEHAKGLFRHARPALLESPMMRNLGVYMSAVGNVTWAMNGGARWDDDIAFLRTPEGQRYVEELTRRVNRLKEELDERANNRFNLPAR